jgi:hypothetical protein
MHIGFLSIEVLESKQSNDIILVANWQTLATKQDKELHNRIKGQLMKQSELSSK